MNIALCIHCGRQLAKISGIWVSTETRLSWCQVDGIFRSHNPKGSNEGK